MAGKRLHKPESRPTHWPVFSIELAHRNFGGELVITIRRLLSPRPVWFVPALLVLAMVLFGPRAARSNPQSEQSAAAAGSPAATPAHASAPSSVSEAPVLIGTGDLLNVSVFGAPDYVQEVRVDDNGQVTLPFIGQVKLAGMSLNDAEILVAKRLADRGAFKDPQVNIVQKEYMAQNATILGEVQKPGLYPVTGKRTLFDMISAAGGASAKAGETAIITHRGHPDIPETVHLSYDANGLQNSNVPISAGDTIVISKAGIVYVVGDVRVPTGVVLENPNL